MHTAVIDSAGIPMDRRNLCWSNGRWVPFYTIQLCMLIQWTLSLSLSLPFPVRSTWAINFKIAFIEPPIAMVPLGLRCDANCLPILYDTHTTV